jgi:hypothetical protein
MPVTSTPLPQSSFGTIHLVKDLVIHRPNVQDVHALGVLKDVFSSKDKPVFVDANAKDFNIRTYLKQQKEKILGSLLDSPLLAKKLSALDAQFQDSGNLDLYERFLVTGKHLGKQIDKLQRLEQWLDQVTLKQTGTYASRWDNHAQRIATDANLLQQSYPKAIHPIELHLNGENDTITVKNIYPL